MPGHAPQLPTSSAGSGIPVSGTVGISRAAAQRIKGIAIVLMLAHHLYGLPSLIRAPSTYDPLLPFLPLEYMLGRIGKVCVPIFLLLSGYGFGRSLPRPDRGLRASWERAAQKAGQFLATYIYYLAIMCLVVWLILSLYDSDNAAGLAIAQRLTPALALTLGKPPIYEWWFAQTYLALVLMLPLLLRATCWAPGFLAVAFTAFLAGAALDVLHVNPPLLSISNILIWQLPFCFGLLLATQPRFARLLLPAHAGPYTWRIPLAAAALFAIGALLVERVASQALTPWLIVTTPIVIPPLILLTRNAQGAAGRALEWLGERSLPIWLIHPLLCIHLAQEWIYSPRQPALILALLLGTTLLFVLPLETLRMTLYERARTRVRARIAG